MPHTNGIKMLKTVKFLAPDTPSIIITSQNQYKYYKEIWELDVKTFVEKPVKIEKLYDAIQLVVNDIKSKDLESDKLLYLTNANKKILDIGCEITIEKNIDKLLEDVLLGAKELSNADGGTLYLVNSENNTLEFKISINDTLKIHNGGTGKKASWPPIKILNEDNTVNKKNVSVVCAAEKKLININNIYQSTNYNFTGAKDFDAKMNYKTTSMLVVPMTNGDDEIIGVIQLINKKNNEKVTSFVSDDEILIKSMASLATMILRNKQLVIDLEELLYSLIKSIGSAINAKSKYTAEHIDNVAILSEIIAHGINKNEKYYKDVIFNENELEEIRLAALLHDIGKISTPAYIMDKATKLETIYDRIHSIKNRFELTKKDVEIAYLKNTISKTEMKTQIQQLDDDFSFLDTINDGQTFMSDDNVQRLQEIFEKYDILDEDELYNLSIKAGTLTQTDRDIINNHVVVTYDMIKDINFPKKFSNVVKIASSHHKTLDGKGYAAKDIMDLELSLADSILVLSDIFEALSTQNRPYRKPNTVDQIAYIFISMIENKILDKDLVKMFFEDKLYLEYAKEHLNEEQIDELTASFDSI